MDFHNDASSISQPRKQRYSSPNLLHLVFGHPSSSKKLNWFSLLLNAALVGMCLDLMFTPLYGKEVAHTTFVRVGAVGADTVKIVARVPSSLYSSAATNSPQANSTLFHHAVVASTPVDAARLVYRPVRPHGPWQYGGVLAAGPETDYVTAVKLESLLPSTQYEYALVMPDDQAHRFQPPSVEHPQYFTTAPDPRLSLHQTHFKFAASSCIKPGWPYVPGEDHLSIKGAADLADRLHSDKIDFMVGVKTVLSGLLAAKGTFCRSSSATLSTQTFPLAFLPLLHTQRSIAKPMPPKITAEFTRIFRPCEFRK